MTDPARVLRGVTNREVRDVLRRAMRAGCSVSITGATHVRVVTPSGVAVMAGTTPSSRYAHKKLTGALRRNGVRV